MLPVVDVLVGKTVEWGVGKTLEAVRGERWVSELRSAMPKIISAVAGDLVSRGASAQAEDIVAALREWVGMVGNGSESVQAEGDLLWDHWLAGIESGLQPLYGPIDQQWTTMGLLGVAQSRREVATIIMNTLVRLLSSAQIPPTSPLSDVVSRLRLDRNERMPLIHQYRVGEAVGRSAAGEQAKLFDAWISLAASTPVVVLENASDRPIRFVEFTPALIALGDRGEVRGQVGNGSLSGPAEIGPGVTWQYPLSHCAGWGRSPDVISQLHTEFTDAGGRRWLNAHDHLSLLREDARSMFWGAMLGDARGG